LLPVEQVDEVVRVVPTVCRHCGQPLPETTARGRGRAWRHQVVELLPLAVRLTEYQMAVRRCAACGRRTRANLPPGVSRRPFGARLTAVVALLSGRYRLSRREVRQLLQDLFPPARADGCTGGTTPAWPCVAASVSAALPPRAPSRMLPSPPPRESIGRSPP
jgi:hypothetical protein